MMMSSCVVMLFVFAVVVSVANTLLLLVLGFFRTREGGTGGGAGLLALWGILGGRGGVGLDLAGIGGENKEEAACRVEVGVAGEAGGVGTVVVAFVEVVLFAVGVELVGVVGDNGALMAGSELNVGIAGFGAVGKTLVVKYISRKIIKI